MGHKVFLSFTTEDKPLVERFRNQTRNAHSVIEFRDYSIKPSFDSTWKTDCERIMGECSALICFIGKNTHKSDNVNWEIRRAAELGKKIMAVYLASFELPIPAALKELGIRPVVRNTDSVIEELERTAR